MNLVRLMRISNKHEQIIVGSQSLDLYTTKRLLLEARKLNIKAQHLNPYEHSLYMDSKKKLKTSPLSGLYFHRTTGVNFDDFDLLVSAYHRSLQFQITNPIESLSLFRTKDQQSLFFKLNRLPFIPTFVFRGELSLDVLQDLESLSPKSQKYVLKMNRGNGGIGVNYVESLKSLVSLLETFRGMRDQKMLIQPFVPHDKEWRVFVLKNEILACIEKKISASDFRGNSKKSTGRFIKKPNPKLQELIHQAFTPSGLDYAGIDVMLNKETGELVVCEMNAIPGFEQVEKLSQVNIAKELITRI